MPGVTKRQNCLDKQLDFLRETINSNLSSEIAIDWSIHEGRTQPTFMAFAIVRVLILKDSSDQNINSGGSRLI